MASKVGNGTHYSGQKGKDHLRNKLSWKDPEMTVDKTKLKRSGSMKTQPDRYNKLSKNPSGASNIRTMP